MGAEQAPSVIRALLTRAAAALGRTAPEAETAAAPRAAPAAAGVVADDVVAATGTNAGRGFVQSVRNWWSPPKPVAPEAVPAAPAAPAAPAPAAPAPAAPAAPAPAAPAPAAPAGNATITPAADTQPSLARRLIGTRADWARNWQQALREGKKGAVVLGAAGVGYAALQVHNEATNPVQTPEQIRLQKAGDAQQRIATEQFARPGNREARRDGSTEIIAALPPARDRLESSVPRTTGVLTNFTRFGAPVRAINEGGVRKLEWDYSALTMGPGDSVTFAPSMNARTVAPHVYRTDDPGPTATSAGSTLTYSGVTKPDTVELNAGALANRHRVAVTPSPAP